MKKKNFKNLKLKHFENKEKNERDIDQKEKTQTPPTNSIDQETFYRRYRHSV